MTIDIIDGVRSCIADSLMIAPEKIQKQTQIIGELGADSLDFMDIIFKLDEKFDVSLQKEDFDLIKRLGRPAEEVVVNGQLTDAAKTALKEWLPAIPVSENLRPSDLGKFLTVEVMGLIVSERLSKK